jgi:uracil DNA glycosylase
MEKKELSSQEIIAKIQEQLTPSGWYDAMRFWWISSDFEKIIVTLKEYITEGKRWVPGAAKMFRWMKECPYDKVKVVILVEDVSGFIESNTGIPLHIDAEKTPEGKEIKRKPLAVADDLLKGLNLPEDEKSYDLLKWCKQGVLLVPLSPTCRITGAAHYHLWSSMYPRLWEMINKKGDIPIILIKDKAIAHEDYLASSNIRKIVYPVWKDKTWHIWVNDVLKSQKKSAIKW